MARPTFGRRCAVAVGAVVTLSVGSVVATYLLIGQKLGQANRVDLVSLADAPSGGGNYLVVGSDSRAFVETDQERVAFGDEGGQRSDTIMVIHAAPGDGRSVVVSFPRDLLVDIPGEGRSRINAAFNQGPDKIVETLSSNFGISIHHYLEVDFRSFQGVVDAIGSVPVYFPYAARDVLAGLSIPSGGCWELTGPQALAYVRSRGLQYFSQPRQQWIDVDEVPDIDRIERQQAFIRTLFRITVDESLSNPFTANGVADEVLEHLTVDQDLGAGDVLKLAAAMSSVDDATGGLRFETMPWEDGPPVDGQLVLYPKDPEWHEMVAQLEDFSGDDPADAIPTSDVSVEVLNGTDRAGAAREVLTQLSTIGFRAAGARDDPRGPTVEHTEVRFQPGAGDEARVVARYVEPEPELVEDASLTEAEVAVVVGGDFDGIAGVNEQAAAALPTAAGGARSLRGRPVEAASARPQSPVLIAARRPAVPAGGDPDLGPPAPVTPPCTTE
jgi:LCP family protein required for cell wall assembly